MYEFSNRIISGLPVADLRRIRGSLVLVDLLVGEILFDGESIIDYVYFPIDCVIALGRLPEKGCCSNFVGREGVVGASIFLGESEGLNYATVERSGRAYCMSVQAVMDMARTFGRFRMLILSYMQALVASSLQTAICDSSHPPYQRLIRALLVSDDRMLSGKGIFTQEFMARMIGAPCQLVAEIARKLDDEGLITYDDGVLTISNRMGLEKNTCECYWLVNQEFDRLLPNLGCQGVGRLTLKVNFCP